MNAPRKTLWWGIILGWTAYGGYMTFQLYVVSARLGQPISLWDAVVSEVSYSSIWIFLTPLILAMSRRFPFVKGIWRRSLAIHLGASFVLALLHKGIHAVVVLGYLSAVAGITVEWSDLGRRMFTFFDYGVQLYWIVVLIHEASRYYVRLREEQLSAMRLQTQLTQAKLDALKMQLQPHFLFNTLNAISVLIEKHPGTARTTLRKLGDLLRMSLDQGNHQERRLEEELDFIRQYLEIEQVRFGDRLRISIEADPSLAGALVPRMILQPLVENAIKHGVGTVRGPAIIRIRAERSGANLSLTVLDNGRGLPPGGPDSLGIGLTNTRSRLEALYGSAHTVTLTPAAAGGTEARLILPLHPNGSPG